MTTIFAWMVRTAKVKQRDVRRAVREQRLQGIVHVQRACTGHRCQAICVASTTHGSPIPAIS